ncbi:unknown protein [Nostoc sp. NIES-3756]|jgi:hypothetical protein|uniref:hypothetical protein n=1 Tax=Nostoc sp. NIES-3756 TaxID=1751286 RepID=UPI00071F704B|nr:hypothetical protein [Nostoc sp. NIES-3756]BAT51777.1 unknown protein [Nostoc sp. NIES-3756]BAY40512.1 hypothetical protein NIES2111_48970 [Nostoc sp. NIES-2111]
MRKFAKLSSITLLLCSLVYPPFLAEAKASINSNDVEQKSVEVEASLINSQTEGTLLAQRPRSRRRYIRRPYVRRGYIRRQGIRRRYIRRSVRRGYIRRPVVGRRYIRRY